MPLTTQSLLRPQRHADLRVDRVSTPTRKGRCRALTSTHRRGSTVRAKSSFGSFWRRLVWRSP